MQKHPKIQELIDKKQVLYHVYRGSYVYGTYIEGKSDKDESGVFMASPDNLFGLNYKEQVNDDKNDVVFYELKRFLELLMTNNPGILELLFTDSKFHIYKHPAMDLIFENKHKFITKLCKNSFCGYAVSQIKKAKGLDKKMNWEKEQMQRKTVLDFCYVPDNCGSIPIKEWLEKRNLKQEYCGLVNLPHMRGVFSVFYDFSSHKEEEGGEISKKWIKFPELHSPEFNCSDSLKYKGIVQKENLSNDISFSEIPKKDIAICTMSFNKDSYSTHCKKYNEYQDWLQKRNTQRYVDIEGHGQQIDGKNMLHCVRLIKTAREISEGKGIIVERPDAIELLKIRRGEVDLDSLISWSEEQITIVDKLFEESNLPDSVDSNFVNDLLIQIRKEYFKI
jgi:predicted nucleotidyltransferase